MKMLFVFYDSGCGLCSLTRTRLARLIQAVPLVFVAYQDPAVQAVFPGLTQLNPGQNIIAMSDTGDIYEGDSAWITILWALRDYRRWALRLAQPRWRPHARRIVETIAKNRQRISRWFRLARERP